MTSRRPGGIEHISVDAVPHSLSVSPGHSAEFKCTALGKPRCLLTTRTVRSVSIAGVSKGFAFLTAQDTVETGV